MDEKKSKVMVLVGNFLIDPTVLRRFLKKTCYILEYCSEKELIVFWLNDGNGKETIFEIRNASLENAQKLAIELGLESDGETLWSKHNPKMTLHNDSSPEADVLRVMLLKANYPFEMIKAEKLSVSIQGNNYEWPFEDLKRVVQEQIKNYWKVLNSTP